MKYPRIFTLMTLAVLLMAALGSAALGQGNDSNLANVMGGGASIKFDVVAQNAGVSLTITAPDGRIFAKEYRAGTSPGFDFSDKGLPDGIYGYELRLNPALTAAQRDVLKAARGNDDDPEADRSARKRVVPNLTQSGSFAVVNGQVITAGLSENGRGVRASAQPVSRPESLSANTATRLRNHRMSLLSSFRPDVVTADDEIIQGSLCVGLDCVNNESFGFDTIRLKENNTRIKFDDTSVSSGFPANDWQLTANDSASGGANKFSIEDITGAKVPFTIRAGAPTNSVFVDSTGRLGLRTSTPVLDVHAATSNTPAMRFEQNNTGGFTAQTWDVAGNEANFFVRDVTGGSRLPFRIRPGAPTSSIDISATGNVGIRTASPNALLSVLNSSFDGDATGVTLGVDGTFFHGLSGAFSSAPTGNRLGFIINSGVGTRGTVMTLRGDNRVGIGTTNPDQSLSVNGDASKVGGGSWQTFSDERLKNIKGNFTSGLSAVMRLQPLRYEYKSDNALGLKSEGDHIGFGAQALQKVIPEAVTQNSEGYLMVNNDPIIWTMLNAIKEQQKEIEQLKGQIRKLQANSHRRRR